MLDKLCTSFVEQLLASDKMNDIFCLVGTLRYAVFRELSVYFCYMFSICCRFSSDKDETFNVQAVLEEQASMQRKVVMLMRAIVDKMTGFTNSAACSDP